MHVALYVGRDNTFYDVTQLLLKTTWSGRKGAAPRTVEAVLYDSEMLESRVKVNAGEGQTVILYEVNEETSKKNELFRGLLMSEKYSSTRQLTIKAYDMCIRFTNNKASFSYKKKRADQIVRDCCKKLGLPVGTLANTGYKIGELVKKSTTYWDVIEDALSQTYKTKGKRYYVYAEKGKIYLKERKETSSQRMIELGHNIESYDRTRSIEDTRTRLKLVTSKGSKKNSTVVKSLEKKIGKFQDMQSVDEKITKTEIKQRIKAFKTEQAVVGQTLKVTAIGDSGVITGGCVYVGIETQKIERTMFVEEDTHTWEKGRHTMSLKLEYS